jgi:hypothetical protein
MMKLVCTLGFAFLVVTATASAQFRPDQPPVLEPSVATPSDNGAAVIGAFRQKYTSAKQPRIALFWNRELTENIARQTYERVSTDSTKSNSETSVGDKDNKNSEKMERAHSTTIKSVESGDDNQHASMDPRTDALLKTTFVEVMRNGGVRFIDHSVMVRTASTEAGASQDAQLNEIKGLQNKADWLMEITLVPDTHAPLGQAFRIAVKELKSGALVTELYTPAVPPPHGARGYVAVNGGNGFERAPEAPITVREVGYTLGLETMGQLSNVL